MLVETAKMESKEWWQTLFLTPDAPVDDGNVAYRGFLLPANPVEIQALLDGIWSMLGEDKSWLNYGEMTAEETAQFFRDVTVITAFCSEILNCFNDPEWLEEFVQKLNDAGIGTGSGASRIDGTSTGDTVYGDLFAGTACDDDLEIYGKALEAVATLHRMAEDCFEVIEVITNAAELAAELSDNIPVIGQSASIVLEVGTWLQDTMQEIYAAAYNATTQEEIACAIYCQYLQDCEMTVEGLINAYNRVISIQLPSLSDFASVVDWIVSLALNTDAEIVCAMHIMVLQAINYGSQWFGATGFALRNAIATAEDASEPPSCGCGWCYEIDFDDMVRYIPSGCTVANFGTRSGANWIQTTRNYDTNCTGFGVTAIAIQFNFGGNYTVDEVEVHYSAQRAEQNPEPNDNVYLRIFNDEIDTLGLSISNQFGEDQEMVFMHKFTDNYIRLEWWLGHVAAGNPTGATGTITKIILRGYTGVNPFGDDNCT